MLTCININFMASFYFCENSIQLFRVVNDVAFTLSVRLDECVQNTGVI